MIPAKIEDLEVGENFRPDKDRDVSYAVTGFCPIRNKYEVSNAYLTEVKYISKGRVVYV